MKLRSLLLVVIAAVLAVALPRPASALEVSFSFFQESLSPYGEWLEVGDYGYCWRPTGVDADWAPYSDGYWTYTDGGWTWVSYEDFGGIVYHYGRWVNVEDEGWCWKPDYEWGPAWVSWRNSDDYVGWAPLPPEAHWRRDRGFSVWVDHSYDIAPSCYNFVRVVDFGAPVLRPWVCHRRDNAFYVQKTVNITNISYNTGADCVFNGGPDFVRINRFAQRPIPALKLVRNTNVTVVNNTIINNNVRVRNVNAVQQGNQLVVVAPNVIRPDREQITALVKPNVRRSIPQARVTKGWGALPAEERNAVRARFKQEAKDLTPETAPARPVNVADLQAVPKKADPDAASPTAIRKDRPRPGAPTREKVTAETAPGVTPPADAPAETAKPADPREAARIAREKAKQKAEPGVVATPPAPDAPATAKQPAAVDKPADPREAAKIAREKAARQKATPEPKPVEVATPSTPDAPVARERGKPGRPDVIKPFNPAATAEQPSPAKTPDADDAAAKRAAAQQAAQERAAAAREKSAEQQQSIRQRQAAQDAARERAAEQQQQQQQQQQQIIRQRQMDEQAEGAARKRAGEAVEERQRKVQQQQNQSAVRERVEQQEALRQRQAQSQEAARERAAQASAQRQRAVESQQQQQQQQAAANARAAQAAEARQQGAEQQQVQAARAAAAERSQAQAARQQAVQHQQAQAAARAEAQQNAARQQAPPQQRQAPVQRGKRQLTPEEAEALEKKR